MLFWLYVNFSFLFALGADCWLFLVCSFRNSLRASVTQKKCGLARAYVPAYAPAPQGFCTFCFHNLHTKSNFVTCYGLEIMEIRPKTMDFFQIFSHVFPKNSDVSLKSSDISVFSSPICWWNLRLLILPFSLFSASFQSLNTDSLKICLKMRGNKLIDSCLWRNLWRLWKQKVQKCRVRARVRTRERVV